MYGNMVSFTSCYWGWEWDSSNTGIVSWSRKQTCEKNLTHCVILSSGYFKPHCLASFSVRNIPCDRSERRSGSKTKAGEREWSMYADVVENDCTAEQVTERGRSSEWSRRNTRRLERWPAILAFAFCSRHCMHALLPMWFHLVGRFATGIYHIWLLT